MAKRHSASPTLREMHIKVTVKYPVTPVRRATIKNKTKQNKKTVTNKCLQGYGEKGIFMHSQWESKLRQPAQKTVLRLLKK